MVVVSSHSNCQSIEEQYFIFSCIFVLWSKIWQEYYLGATLIEVQVIILRRFLLVKSVLMHRQSEACIAVIC